MEDQNLITQRLEGIVDTIPDQFSETRSKFEELILEQKRLNDESQRRHYDYGKVLQKFENLADQIQNEKKTQKKRDASDNGDNSEEESDDSEEDEDQVQLKKEIMECLERYVNAEKNEKKKITTEAKKKLEKLSKKVKKQLEKEVKDPREKKQLQSWQKKK